MGHYETLIKEMRVGKHVWLRDLAMNWQDGWGLKELSAAHANAYGRPMRKATGPTIYVGDMATLRRTMAELTRPKAKAKPKAVLFRKAADAGAHPLMVALKPAIGLQTARVKFAEMNSALTRAALNGSMSAVEVAKAEGELARLGDLIRQLEGTSVESGEDANQRNRRGPQ
jgi:hypothetical protein